MCLVGRYKLYFVYLSLFAITGKLLWSYKCIRRTSLRISPNLFVKWSESPIASALLCLRWRRTQFVATNSEIHARFSSVKTIAIDFKL